MEYVIYCDLINAWCGDTVNGKVVVAWNVKKARKFVSVADAKMTIQKLHPVWQTHMQIREYTESTHHHVDNSDISAEKKEKPAHKTRLLSFKA